MADNHHTPDIDKVTGRSTTGHEWDGIKELETPLPRWWLWLFYITIIWSIGYWIVYPAWPTISSNTTGLFGWNSRVEIAQELEGLKKLRGDRAAKIAAATPAEIKANPELLAFAMAAGKAAFGDNCAPCHGTGATGSKGYPNLNDDDWLWGGTLDAVQKTITFGIRSGDPKGHDGNMTPFGPILKREEVAMLARHVRALAGLPTSAGYDKAKGTELYQANCAACHQDSAKGNIEVGAPNLTDAIWLYGSDEASISETIVNGRGGVMPAWGTRLDATTLKSLTVYVHSLGGGK